MASVVFSTVMIVMIIVELVFISLKSSLKER